MIGFCQIASVCCLLYLFLKKLIHRNDSQYLFENKISDVSEVTVESCYSLSQNIDHNLEGNIHTQNT